MDDNSSRIAKLQAMIAADGSNELAHFLLAEKYMEGGAYIKAMAEFRRTVELNPSHIVAWRYLGLACERMGDFKEAASAYKHARIVAEEQRNDQACHEIEAQLAHLPLE